MPAVAAVAATTSNGASSVTLANGMAAAPSTIVTSSNTIIHWRYDAPKVITRFKIASFSRKVMCSMSSNCGRWLELKVSS